MENKNLLAQRLKFPGEDSPEIVGPKGTDNGLLGEDLTLAKIISEAIKLTFFAAGLVLFGYLLYGGFKYLTSLGDDAAIEEAKGTITYALIGFFIIFAAYFITLFFGRLFGITIF